MKYGHPYSLRVSVQIGVTAFLANNAEAFLIMGNIRGARIEWTSGKGIHIA